MTIAHTTGTDDYRKSSFSEGTNSCVAVRRDLGGAQDTKNGATLPARGMPTFVALIKRGQFDRLA